MHSGMAIHIGDLLARIRSLVPVFFLFIFAHGQLTPSEKPSIKIRLKCRDFSSLIKILLIFLPWQQTRDVYPYVCSFWFIFLVPGWIYFFFCGHGEFILNTFARYCCVNTCRFWF